MFQTLLHNDLQQIFGQNLGSRKVDIANLKVSAISHPGLGQIENVETKISDTVHPDCEYSHKYYRPYILLLQKGLEINALSLNEERARGSQENQICQCPMPNATLAITSLTS